LSSHANFKKLENFGANLGDLEASYFTPNTKNPALVVLLHGCAQQGGELAINSGLLGLAKKHKFALLLPQQGLSNNIKRCFNWYSADDFTRDSGETDSIKNMISSLKAQLASRHVYIIGLSAGGAMASGMLANYPALFTGGAVVAGIPFSCADGLITGISCMRNGPSQTPVELITHVKNLNPTQKIWPKLSVWTGVNDNIVNPLNSSMLAQQWANLSALKSKPIINQKSGYTITRWKNAAQEIRVELVEVNDLGHGIMVNPNIENGGKESDYLLASPVSTVKHVIDFWQLSL
jgi:poly(hydroxyalkanoate) depolymerase family esterase